MGKKRGRAEEVRVRERTVRIGLQDYRCFFFFVVLLLLASYFLYNIIPAFISSYSLPYLVYLLSQFPSLSIFCCHRVHEATLVPEAHFKVSVSDRQTDPGSLLRMFMPASA